MDLNYLEARQTDNIVPDLMIAHNAEKDDDPMRIILMLYDGCISYLDRAIEYAESGDIKNKNIYINKAGDIIFELDNALNIEAGGEIAENLRTLYVFMARNLVDAAQKNNTRGLNEAIKMLSRLKEAWDHVAESMKGSAGKGMKLTN